jgi:TonB family protein
MSVMQDRPNKNFPVWLWLALALLTHFLLLLGFTIQFIGSPHVDTEDKPLPAYFYHEDKPRPTPAKMPDTTADTPPPEQQASAAAPAPKEVTVDTNGTLPAAKPVVASPQIQNEGQTKNSTYKTPMGAINFKAKNEVDRPLLRILSKATAAKLFFPKIAQDFEIRGTARIRFLIAPDGVLSEITLVESSGAGVLDQAALQTMNAISPVADVGPYLKEPQYLVVALIYG